MKILNKIKEKAKEFKNYFEIILSTLILTPAFCLPDENTDPEIMITSIITLILTIARWVGVVLLVWGIFQMVMSFKDENAEGKSRSMLFIGSSIALIGLKSLLTVAGII